MKTISQLGLFIASLALAVSASAQGNGMSHTTTTSTTTSESDNPIPPQNAPPGSYAAAPTQDFLMTSTFGSKATSGLSGCKVEDASKDVIKDLKTQCMAWMNDKHAEMREKYVTGTCEEQCSDCGMSMQRCTVKGVIHYAK